MVGKLDILLVNPHFGAPLANPRPPFWYLLLKPHLDACGLSSFYLDLRPFDAAAAAFVLRTRLEEFSPRAVGLTAMTGSELGGALAASRLARAAGAAVVWGGVHASLFPEQTLRTAPVDYVVAGEGERVLPELLGRIVSGASASGIPGVARLDSGAFDFTPAAKFLDLAAEPAPAWDALSAEELERYAGGDGSALSLYTSRGCPAACAFCYNQAYNRRRWRATPAEAVLRQVDALRSRLPGLKRLVFCDDNFAVDRARLREIATGLGERGLKWECDLRCDAVDEGQISFLCAHGLDGAYLGIESASGAMLQRLSKGIAPEQAWEAARVLSRHLDSFTATFMFGLPGETLADVRESLRLISEIVRRCKRPYIQMRFYTPYPGCPLFEECAALGFRPPQSAGEWAETGWLDPVARHWLPEGYLEEVARMLCVAKLAASAEHRFSLRAPRQAARGLLQFAERLRLRAGFYRAPVEINFLRQRYGLTFE